MSVVNSESIRGKKENTKKIVKKQSQKLQDAAGSILRIGIFLLIWFSVGSWQLSLFCDQLSCKKGDKECLLPSNINKPPYSNGNLPGTYVNTWDTFKELATAFIPLQILYKLGIYTKNPSGQKGGLNEIPTLPYAQTPTTKKKAGGQQMNTILTKINILGWEPFNIFNNVQFPYDLAASEDTSFLNFRRWFGYTFITSWSLSRGILSGYLDFFRMLMVTKNKNMGRIIRFFLSLFSPIIIGTAIFMAPIVSFATSIYALFAGNQSIVWGLIALFSPLALINMFLQGQMVAAYAILGGILGSGKEQFINNMSAFVPGRPGGYMRIIQIMGTLGLLGMLGLFIAGKVQENKEKKDAENKKNK
jgi:hypothetical protein